MKKYKLKPMKIGQLLNLKRGYDLTKNEMIKGAFPVVGSNGIIGFHNVSTCKSPCVTVGRSGTVGATHLYKQDCWIHNTCLYVDDFKGNDPLYIYYLLKVLNLEKIANSTSTPTLNRNFIHPLKINAYVNVKEQQKIGRILSSIDDKIAINNQINAILERVARAIYEYYFVQFDFPNNQGKPYKSSGGAMHFDPTLNRQIPKDFEVQNLNTNSLTSIIPPNIEIFEGEKVYLPTANIQNDKIADFSNKITYKNRESRANMQPIANSVWFAKMKKSKKVLYFADYSQEWLDNLILSTGFYGLHCKNSSLEYIWNTINSTHFENQKDRLAHGATQEAVNNDDLLSIPLLIPTNEVIEKFHNQVKFLYKQKYMNDLQNQKLKNLRDFLLPLLINAQVQIQ